MITGCLVVANGGIELFGPSAADKSRWTQGEFMPMKIRRILGWYGTLINPPKILHLELDMLEFIRPILAEAEQIALSGDLTLTLRALRRLGLDDYALLTLSLPNADYPALSRVLPSMAPEQVQRDWTGAAGIPLLRQSLTFVRTVRAQFEAQTGRRLAGANILDYGCGYGRLLRLMLYYSEGNHLSGCDPWDVSIEHCQRARIPCRLERSDYLPERLPYDNSSFDFIYAFSVFTHTSFRAMQAALRSLRAVVKSDGILALTIRPIEYWEHDQNVTRDQKQDLVRAHNESGFAFRPHNRPAVDGDITYGDTSMSFDFLDSVAEGWTVTGYERSIDDPYQIIVYLAPSDRA